MQYALLIYTKPGTYDSLSAAEREALSLEYYALRDEPGMLGGAALQPVTTATTIRLADGKPLVTDGPFAEAKEVLGGYWMIDVASRDEAIAWAKRCPASENEIIEIRQVQEMSDFSDEVQHAARGFEELQKASAHKAR